MELGIFNHFPYQFTIGYHDFPRPNKQFDPIKGHDLYMEYLDEFVHADNLGFDVLAFNEHHSKEYNLDIANLNDGDMPHDKALKNLETFAKKVMPELSAS